MAQFLAATAPYDRAKAVVYGLPMDWTVAYRPGCRLGPDAVREASWGLEEFCPSLGRGMADSAGCDAGDAPLPAGDVEGSLKIVEQAAERFLRDNKFPVFLGGEHLLTLGTVRPFFARYPDLALVQLDAHADLREEYQGRRLSHATVMRRLSEVLPPGSLYQVGVRSATQEEVEYAAALGSLVPGGVLQAMKALLPELARRPLYVSLDIDVADPAFAPGTGSPEPGGPSSAELLEALSLLGRVRLVGFDLVEVAPPYDPSGITAYLAARVVRDVLLLVA
ncbi:MAG: agmatinase [Acetobacteraceae bacterium]|nr:agmatinase [Acetobacteraceae bacterium]